MPGDRTPPGINSRRFLALGLRDRLREQSFRRRTINGDEVTAPASGTRFVFRRVPPNGVNESWENHETPCEYLDYEVTWGHRLWFHLG